MTDYTKLITDLRSHIRDVPLTLLRDAADALEALIKLVDLNTERCEALRKQLREAHESYEKHIDELEAQIPKHGEWMRADLPDAMTNKCSLCGYEVWDEYRYCPNCGAEMRGEHDAES
jgi:hypothetical protein